MQVLQNKLLKVLLAKNYKYSTNKLHNDLKLIKVKDIAKLEASTFIHNYFNNKLPPVFNNYFTLITEIHDRVTRRSEKDIYFKTYKTNIGISSMKSIGAKNWNELSNSYKDIKNMKTFRKSLIKDILFYPTDDVNWYHCTGNEQPVEYSIYLFTFSSLLGIRNKISYTLETMLSQIPKIFYFMCHFRYRVLSAIDRLSIRILYNYTHILWFIRDLYLFIYILIISYILKSCYIQIWISIYHLFHLLD